MSAGLLERFDIAPVVSAALTDVAAFLHRWQSNDSGNNTRVPRVKKAARETAGSLLRRLKWLLLDNPVPTSDGTLGYCLRDDCGTIRGLNLCHPAAFLSGDKQLSGLCSGSFFVESPARSLGFFLFKRYLSTPGYSFHFASTCNANSSRLWRSIGASAVPNSEKEYILPLRLGAIIPAYVARRTSSRMAAGLARLCGRGADPVLRLLRRPAAQLSIERSADWEKLAGLARRHRVPSHITINRSAALLEWRYGPDSPSHPCDIFLFQDKLGNEGWFALGNCVRGETGKFRSCILLDAVWPREQMSFRVIFQEIVRLTASTADAITFRGLPGVDYGEYSRFVISRKLVAPRVFVRMPTGAARFPLDSLECDDSDYIAWTFRWREA